MLGLALAWDQPDAKPMKLNRIAKLALMLPIAFCCATGADDAYAAGKCRFAKRPPVVLKDPAGFCNFDSGTLTFSGAPAEQARCLLNPVQPVGRLGPALDALPEAIALRVGGDRNLPPHAALDALLRERGAPTDLIATLADPVSHAHDNDPLSRSATYVVFHDTSTPNYRTQPWPVTARTKIAATWRGRTSSGCIPWCARGSPSWAASRAAW